MATVLVLARPQTRQQPLLPQATRPLAHEAAMARSEGVVEASTVVENVVPFRWAQLESEDFPNYVANLRAVHCPESIIRDLVFHDLERAYETRQAKLPQSDVFWKSRDFREREDDTRTRQLREMELEKRAVMRALLGVSWSKEAWDFWYNDGFAEIAEHLVGFLKNDQVLGAITAYFDMEQSSGDLRDQCDLCSEEEARVRNEAAYQRVVDTFAAVMLAPELEEMALRISLVDGKLEDFTEAEFYFCSGAELRDFAKLCNQFEPFFSKPFLGDRDDDESNAKQFQTAVQTLLGKERFAVFERSQNGSYREFWRFGQERNLAADTILKAWQVREMAEQELAQLKARNEHSQSEQSAECEEVRHQTEAALIALLGKANSAEYFKKHGAWLKAPTTKPGGKS